MDWDAFNDKQMRNQLDAVVRAVLPAQFVDAVVEAVLSESSPLLTPAVHSAAIKREIQWQHHWADKHEVAEREIFRLRSALDVTALDRIRLVIELIGEMRPSRTAKHDEGCHERHAACLASRIRHALNGV